MRTILVMLCVVMLSASAVAEPTFSFKAYDVILSGADCATQIQRLAPIAQEAEAAKEPGQAADMHAVIASCYAQLDDAKASLRHLEKAISLGYSDCFYLRTNKAFAKVPGVAAVIAKAKLAPADFEEIVWAHGEVQAIVHETNMAITQNMNRRDSDWTQMFPNKVSARATSDVSVLLARWAVVYMQSWQRNTVRQSDQSRILHITKMSIINGEYASQERVVESRRTALFNAQSRQSAAASRAYKPSNKPTTPVSCSAY